MIYLASPYSDPCSMIREDRYLKVAQADLMLNKAGLVSISPIVHWHLVAIDNNLETDSTTWASINKRWLANAELVAVLCIEGWQESKGVALELKWARELGKPVVFLEGSNEDDWLIKIFNEECRNEK